MAHIPHLRNQFPSINIFEKSYVYIIMLIDKRKNTSSPFWEFKCPHLENIESPSPSDALGQVWPLHFSYTANLTNLWLVPFLTCWFLMELWNSEARRWCMVAARYWHIGCLADLTSTLQYFKDLDISSCTSFSTY